MKRKSALFNILLVVIFLTVGLSSPVKAADPGEIQISLIRSTTDSVRFEVEIPWSAVTIDNVELENGTFSRVSLPGSAVTDQTGAPELPVIGQMVAVPFGVEVELRVEPGKQRVLAIDHPVIPVPEQVAEQQVPGDLSLPEYILDYTPDPSFYSGTVYPSIIGKIANEGIMRQQRVVGVALYPVEYDPANATLTVYESFTVTLAFRGNAVINQAAAEPESLAYEEFFRGVLLNYETSRDWSLSAAEQSTLTPGTLESVQPASLPWVPPDPAWRVLVREDGLYRLTYADLDEAGLDVDGLDPRTLKIYYLGEEIPARVYGEADGNFDSQDSLVFYALAPDSKYTLDNVYWLTYGGANGQRMQNRQVSEPTADIALSHEKRPGFEINKWYIPGMQGGDELERFLWASIIVGPGLSGNWTFTFPLAAPVEAPGQLDLELYGFTMHTEEHHATVSLNNTALGSIDWQGQTWAHFSASIPDDALQTGDNELKVTLDNTSGTLYDYIYVDKFTLAYTSAFLAEGDVLTYQYDLDTPVGFELAGFSASDLALIDVSSPIQPVELTGFNTLLDDMKFKLRFQEENGISGSHSYYAASSSAFLSAYAIEQDSPSSLQLPANGADHLVISHADFMSAADTLADYRQEQGLRAMTIDVQDIYDQFGYGIVSAEPIRAFLAYAYANWDAPAPTYVVLMGDGHYNPKGYNPAAYGTLWESYIPPYLAYADLSIGETAADNRYASIVGSDNLPDMQLGRMVVTTVDQANAFVEKIIAFEQSPVAWDVPVVAVADNTDLVANFPAISEILVQTSLPASVNVQRIYLGVTHGNVDSAREALISAINEGRFLVNYIGHGAQPQWGGHDNVAAYSGRLLGVEDVPGLTNQGMYPVISAMTCWEGYYINPQPGNSFVSLAEVITRAENKGAVASWSPTGASVANGHDIINRGLFKAIFTTKVPTIGQATQQSLQDLWATGTHLDLAETYLLFGDPALPMPLLKENYLHYLSIIFH